MTLVTMRMIGAVAGFIRNHGRFPTAVLVPAENWTEYQAKQDWFLAHSDERGRELLKRLRLVPVPRQLYIAVDDDGNWCDYDIDEGGLREDSLQIVDDALWPPVYRPIENSYVIPGTRLVAGEYPGSPPTTPTDEARTKINAFLDAGIAAFVDLTGPADGLAPYDSLLNETAGWRGTKVHYDRYSIPDLGIASPDFVRSVLGHESAMTAYTLGTADPVYRAQHPPTSDASG